MTIAARFRFFSLGCSISRFTCASDSSPLIASTECPNAMMTPNNPSVRMKFVCFRNPKESPRKQNHDHDRGDLHHLQRFVARLFDSFRVLPPEVDRDDPGNCGGGSIYRKLPSSSIRMHHHHAHPVMGGTQSQ